MDKGQKSLPRLPVPDLEATLERYLRSVKPLLSDEEYQHTEKAVREFGKPGGQGELLQRRLLARAATSTTSWLHEWWNEYAYFAYRDSITFYVNYFFGFRDDPRHPSQLQRAAGLVKAIMEFRQDVVSRQLEPDCARDVPFCTSQYNYMFNSCRFPASPEDHAESYDYETNNHLAVARKGQFYIFDTVRPDGTQLTADDIMSQLSSIIALADQSDDPAFGILTTTDRDRWAENRKMIIEAHPSNKETLHKLETAMFLLSLEDYSPSTAEEFARSCWHGTGKNRYYDKCFQILVFSNGMAGFNGEHSRMDGTVTARMCHFAVEKSTSQPLPKMTGSIYKTSEKLTLYFSIQSAPKILEAIEFAEQKFEDEIEAHEVGVLEYDGYGKGLIKRFKMSPDAYVQMAIQLAYYKMFGVCRATYESAATRKFAYGRTETCRTVSADSVEWVKAMCDSSRSATEKARASSESSIEGRGVDRHLLGLRFLVEPDEPKPEIFLDTSYEKTSHWHLSTSQISDDLFDQYGWGEVVPDGFGLAYMIRERSLHFNCAGLVNMQPKKFLKLIEEALLETRELCTQCFDLSPTVKKNGIQAKEIPKKIVNEEQSVGNHLTINARPEAVQS
ncbi:acyltransferase ChoActase/COT/CPT [Basidiobolus meristosporus CBS 931.73]|uniref:Carnitine O-acetyltransferase, mitochondrial n=1 Tax=Basidiobolus meristosporus CBS 931.73 TaxID=1314790 RepID=A0A1Y1XY59_9FUNG|nr:acyltransferase ChoActase/COT/CPT [Basidiobolus meristosporus CBS 931.73]|eukprot:ORX90672.1 acyltransferase ChoActase/COT/CPT [Basidiobolus meristosporus CBS 931.73]